MIVIRGFSLLIVAAVAGCASLPDNSTQSQEGIPSISYPTEIEGEINTGWELYLSKYNSCEQKETNRVCELYKTASHDTYRSQLLFEISLGNLDPDQDLGMPLEVLKLVIENETNQNSDWIFQTVERDGWFTISEHGVDADKAAFFIVQHSYDRGMQREMLSILSPLADVNETSKRNVALIEDRVLLADEKPQTYGTQGGCTKSGNWEPTEIQSPERLNELRAAMNLEPIGDYIEKMSAFCGN